MRTGGRGPGPRAAAGLLIEWVDDEVGLAAIAAVGHRVVHGGGRIRRAGARHRRPARRAAADRPARPGAPARGDRADRGVPPARPRPPAGRVLRHGVPPRPAARRPDRADPAPVRGARRPALRVPRAVVRLPHGELARVAGPAEAAGPGRPGAPRLGLEPGGGPRGPVPSTRRWASRRPPAWSWAPAAGDIDPGLVAFLVQAEGMTAESVPRAWSTTSRACSGVSETSPDLRDLLARQGDDVRAAEAVELFCYRVKTGDRRPGRGARRAGHARLLRRDRRELARGPAPRLRRARVPRGRPRRGRATRPAPP